MFNISGHHLLQQPILFGSLSLEEVKVCILSHGESNSLCPLQLHMHHLACPLPVPPLVFAFACCTHHMRHLIIPLTH